MTGYEHVHKKIIKTHKKVNDFTDTRDAREAESKCSLTVR